MRYRFSLHNRESLRADRELSILARHLSETVTTSSTIRRLSRETDSPRDGWIIFAGEDGRGFGLRPEYGSTPCSSLQRSLEVVRFAQTVVKGFGGASDFPFTFSLSASPPDSWRVCRVEGVVGTVWCAASLPVLSLPNRGERGVDRDPMIRLRLFGTISNAAVNKVGDAHVMGEVSVQMPEIGLIGRMVVSEGGIEMRVEGQHDDVADQPVPGVRLDLGEIEVRLSDLVGLRAGAVLDLGGSTLERCYLRLGATVLAEGRFSTHEGRLVLTIESVE
jgi:hypothetical protein